VSRHFVSFPITDFHTTKLQMLNWADQFNICCLLDNQQYQLPHHSFECLLAAGHRHRYAAPAGNALEWLATTYELEQDWMFAHLSYDLKNELEQLTSRHPDAIGFPDLSFFIPEFIIQLGFNEINIGTWSNLHEDIYKQILSMPVPGINPQQQPLAVQSRLSRDEYIDIINRLKQHILRGDCYEINFCQEFFAENVSIDPVAVYRSLSNMSPNPFAAFYKLDDKYLLCASPERYLKKTGNKIYSQPIKGTWQRNLSDAGQDKKNKEMLYNSAKDRSENVMIVDLVRNDLSRICEEGTVAVDELFGIYTFPQVHQMISSISGQLRPGIDFKDAIRATFPMGSMTGAPKKRVMELIEQYENTRRGIFSGAVGYITPGGDFDFNVVIRSILYNSSRRYLSFPAGSGITWYSDPENEYEECLLKAAAIRKVLGFEF
jgi:para-aminobenzoate synthetase component 1